MFLHGPVPFINIELIFLYKKFFTQIDEKGILQTKLPPELAKLLGKIVALVKLNLALGVIVLLVTATLGEL